MQRLEYSLQAIKLKNPLSLSQWQSTLQQLIRFNNGLDQAVYLQITRGSAPRDHAFPQKIEPTIFAMSNPIKPVPEKWRIEGVTAVLREDIRWKYCHIKSVALLSNVLLRQEAVESGAQEAILLRDGQLTEGAASNIFIVQKGVLVTPVEDSSLLSGITRDLVLELATEAGILCEERIISTKDLLQADEIWLTSSTREILPVTRLDDVQVGSGFPGVIWQQVDKLYQEYKEQVRSGLYGN